MVKRINNVLEFLCESAKKYPDKVAFADETESITYKQLVFEARKIASGIAKKVAPRTPVAVLGEKSVRVVKMFFACVFAGCFYVPLNPLHPEERRKRILDTLKNPLVLVNEDSIGLLPEGVDEESVVLFKDIEGSEVDELLLQDIAKGHVDIDPLYVMFTSGSTGTPKGIAVSHRSVIDFIDEFTDVFGISDCDVIGNQAPFDFDVSVKDIYSTIRCGATMQIIPKKKFSFPTILIDYLIERKITTLVWAVSALCILSTFRAFQYKSPQTINKILFSGEVMPIKHLNVWRQAFPNATFVNLYGPTEITCNCTYFVLPKDFAQDSLPIGKAFKNEKVFLLDEKDRLVTAVGEAGEVCVSGTCLSLGYYNNKTETAKVFVQNPLNDAYLETIYRTGDLAHYEADGNLYFNGRRDFQIKHMGHRIELSEIENVMMSNENINRAVCIFDSEKDKINAFYVGSIEPTDVIVFLRDKLPAFMIPHKCVKKDVFELNENGKIDRKKLV